MNIKKNQMVAGAVAGVVLLGASFWGGMSYAKSSAPSRGGFAQYGQGAPGGQYAGRAGARGGMGGGITAGQILSRDANSITIKMMDGSTKIVLVSGSTAVMKQASGTQDDLSVGADVSVTGSANSDGSVTASTIQIRPAGSLPQHSTTPAQSAQ